MPKLMGHNKVFSKKQAHSTMHIKKNKEQKQFFEKINKVNKPLLCLTETVVRISKLANLKMKWGA